MTMFYKTKCEEILGVWGSLVFCVTDEFSLHILLEEFFCEEP